MGDAADSGVYWGETKTWYGIPGADAEKFETAIKAEAPELFEQQPSLLYQLVTMMNPGRLSQQDVRVLACDQRPNEFVITFPKAYHCGFNHGVSPAPHQQTSLELTLDTDQLQRSRQLCPARLVAGRQGIGGDLPQTCQTACILAS